jgi:transposase
MSFIRPAFRSQIKQIEDERLQQLKHGPQQGSNTKVLQLQHVNGIGVETADMLTHEVLSRDLRDQRAVARYSGLTGSPDESGSRRQEKGLSKMGNARVRRGMIQLAWRLLSPGAFYYTRGTALWHSGVKRASPRAKSARP